MLLRIGFNPVNTKHLRDGLYFGPSQRQVFYDVNIPGSLSYVITFRMGVYTGSA